MHSYPAIGIFGLTQRFQGRISIQTYDYLHIDGAMRYFLRECTPEVQHAVHENSGANSVGHRIALIGLDR